MKTYTFDGLVPFALEQSHLYVVSLALSEVVINFTQEPQFEAACEELLQALHREGGLNNDDVLTYVIRYRKRKATGLLAARVTFYATCANGYTIPVGAFKHMPARE